MTKLFNQTLRLGRFKHDCFFRFCKVPTVVKHESVQRATKRIKKINKKLKGIAKSSGASSGGSIEVSEAGQQQLDDDKAAATAAPGDGGSSGSGGEMGGS